MQVPVIPPPLVSSALPQEIAAQTTHTAQAVQPISAIAIDPTPKTERTDQIKRRKEADAREEKPRRDSMDGKTADDAGEDEHTVDLSV